MSSRPSPGDRIEMPFMGSDACIEVGSLPEHQPLEEKFGIIFFVDQYGDEQMAQKDGDTWVTASIDDLSDEALEIYEETAIAGAGPSPL